MSQQQRPPAVASRAVSVPAGPKGPPGLRGPRGEHGPGFADVHVITGTTTLTNATVNSSTSLCPDGEIALGGGATVTGQPDASLRTSEPVRLADGTPVGWHVVGVQTAPATLTVDTYTICARAISSSNTG